MKDSKQLLWWLFMPLLIPYFIMGVCLAFISLVLMCLGFRDLPQTILSYLEEPYACWMRLCQYND